jgi:hypothetical protein
VTHASDEGAVDRITEINGLTLGALIPLIERLRQTETPNQFYCREAELDDAYRHADVDLKVAEEDAMDEKRVAEMRRIRQHVIRAHDLVGESNVNAAVDELSRIVEIKIGLGETDKA